MKVINDNNITKISELKSGDTFKLGQDLYMLSHVTKPGRDSGSIAWGFYRAAEADCYGIKKFVVVNLRNGCIKLENDLNVKKVSTKLIIEG
jgi:hypothetical protein